MAVAAASVVRTASARLSSPAVNVTQTQARRRRAQESFGGISITLPWSDPAPQSAATASFATPNSLLEPVESRVFALGPNDAPLLDVYGCGREGYPVDLPAGAKVGLRRSSRNAVCLLRATGDDGRTLARSYDTEEWEPRVGTEDGTYLQSLKCETDACAFQVPNDGMQYQLVAWTDGFSGSRQDNPATQREHEVARFLIQATFGPRWPDIEGFPDNYEEWIRQQMDLPVGSHRQYWRERVGKEIIGEPPRIEKVCQHHSRWSRYLFGPQDVGKSVQKVQEGNHFAFVIDGVVRSRVGLTSKWGQKDLDGRNVCEVEAHGRFVKFGDSECNRRGQFQMQNTKISFPEGEPEPTERDPQIVAAFHEGCNMGEIEGVRSTLIFHDTSDACVCTPPASDAPVAYMKGEDGSWYRFEDMTSLLENDVDTPDPQGCVSAPVSPVNRPDCIVVPGSCPMKQGWVDDSNWHLSCGSPGEVKANFQKGSVWSTERLGKAYDFDGSTISAAQGQPKTIWLHKAITAADQLRQRMAFALSGIWVADLVTNVRQEPGMIYYDIFVRNAFNNYKNVMKEVTYSYTMAGYLTYRGSESFAVTGRHADENYARELMQLFTIGVDKLHMNGTVVMDAEGEPIQTYTEEDIETMARVWTGFQIAEGRNASNGPYSNQIDNLRMNPSTHDQFPKMNLYGGYIGDGYPLCHDFPAQDFLHKGAIYEFFLDAVYDADDREAMAQRVTIPEGSPLYEAICNRAAPNGPCNYQSTLTLPTNLACQGVCEHATVDLVQVGNATFLYVGRPCVTFPFFNEGEEVTAKFGPNWSRKRRQFCADPEWKTSCCGSKLRDLEWTGDSCAPKVKIFPDGKVALVHEVSGTLIPDLGEDNENKFRVVWDPASKDLLPTPEVNNCGPYCEESHGACLCEVEEVSQAVFASAPQRSEIIEQLHVGSVPVDAFDNGEYVLHSMEQGGVSVFTKATGAPFDNQTIFGVSLNVGEVGTKYYRNVVSQVHVVGAPHLKFRSPPMFNYIVRHENKCPTQANSEIDAVLEHLLKHPNTAPFVSYRLIQRFVTSNPSGGYIERVSRAFQSGRYASFGTGLYGDLAATMSAILLDREARSVVLDTDPTQGQLREPLIKMIHVFRSMEFYKDLGNLRYLKLSADIHQVFGQFPYEPPSVFSFFLPDFVRANSGIQRQGLIAPETQLLGYSRMFQLMNYVQGGFENWDSRFISNTTVDQNLNRTADQMNTLFTGGRMSDANLEAIKTLALTTPYRWKLNWKVKLHRMARSFLASPEFQTTNINKPVPRAIPPPPLPSYTSPVEGDFKAIVFIDLEGGVDSMNMLIPHSECEGEDLYEDYKWGRRTIALEKDQMNVIDVPDGQQKCRKFGMPKELGNLHQLYQDGDLTWISSVGTMIGPPVGNHGAGASPHGLNSHSDMFRHLERGWGNAQNVTGVLGRLADVLSDQSIHTRSFGTSGYGATLAGSGGRSPPVDVVGEFAPTLNSYLTQTVDAMQDSGSSVFAQYFDHQVQQGRGNTNKINEALDAAELDPDLFQSDHNLSKKLRTIAKLIQSNNIVDMERGFFTAKTGGFDTHSAQAGRLPGMLRDVDGVIADFVSEMKRQGNWDKVVLVMRSEFGRTHKDNGMRGTDHGWNGNYFIAGGSVRGGQVLGEYPKLRNELPSHSWETIYNGLFEWMGVLPHQMSEALPNAHKFDNLFSMEDLMDV